MTKPVADHPLRGIRGSLLILNEELRTAEWEVRPSLLRETAPGDEETEKGRDFRPNIPSSLGIIDRMKPRCYTWSIRAVAHQPFILILLCVLGFAQVSFGQYENSGYWNHVYKADEDIFVHRPTALLVSAIKGRKPGEALDIGMGQGRNSVFLAQHGWNVTGFDPSSEGVRQAEEQAHKLGLHLHALVAREEDFDLGIERWDLIVMTYVRRLENGDAERFARALKPDGIFVYENNNVGKQNELLRDFIKWRILRFEDENTHADWHPERVEHVERLIAERPAPP